LHFILVGGLNLCFFLVLFFVYNSQRIPTVIEMTSEETRLLDVNTLFYRKLELFDREGGLQTFVFATKPALSKVHNITLYKSFVIPNDYYKYLARYLNAGSKLTVSIRWMQQRNVTSLAEGTDSRSALPLFDTPGTVASSQAPLPLSFLSFCLYKGDFQQWLHQRKKCLFQTTNRSGIEFQYSVTSSDDYYFILENIAVDKRERSLSRDSQPRGQENRRLHSRQEMSDFEIELPNVKKREDIGTLLFDKSLKVATAFLSRFTLGSVREEFPAESEEMRSYIPSSDSVLVRDFSRRRPLSTFDSPQRSALHFVRGNATFLLELTTYDISQAEDLYDGSFVKDFDMWRKEWLVLRNPSKITTHTVTYYFSLRHSVIFVFVAIVEFCSLLFFCWYHRREKRRRLLLSAVLSADERRNEQWFSPVARLSKTHPPKRKANIKLTVPNVQLSDPSDTLPANGNEDEDETNIDVILSTSNVGHSLPAPAQANTKFNSVSPTVHLRTQFLSKRNENEDTWNDGAFNI